MTNVYLGYATSTMQMLDAKWFTANTPLQWGGGGNFWKTPTICAEVVDYMALSDTQTYIQTVENTRLAGEPYIGNSNYNDDATVWGRFFISTYFYLNNTTGLGHYAANYMTDAKNVYQGLVNGWDNVCGGGLWWKRSPPSYPDNTKAMNATLGLMEIALGLYEATQDKSYLAWGQKCWDWIKQSNMIAGGLVIGGLTQQCLPDPANGPVIALQGNPLKPLWQLYAANGDTSLLDVAQSIVDATMRQMSWATATSWAADTAILEDRPDADWQRQDEAFRQQWSGATPFKGIFVGFLGEFAQNLATVSDPTRQAAAKQYAQLLAANADTLYANFPGGAYGMDWHTSQPNYQPDSDDSINAALQYGALALFLAAAKTNP